VIVALDGVADDGELGERDFVEQVENVNAGSGDDLLTGDGKGNRLSGGSGRDTLDGGSGWDRLEGGDDADQIRAADSDADTVDCGAGVDSASVDTLDAVSACENLSWSPIRLELPP
jgi:Ca2+-binding RTX toxin-like protein